MSVRWEIGATGQKTLPHYVKWYPSRLEHHYDPIKVLQWLDERRTFRHKVDEMYDWVDRNIGKSNYRFIRLDSHDLFYEGFKLRHSYDLLRLKLMFG